MKTAIKVLLILILSSFSIDTMAQQVPEEHKALVFTHVTVIDATGTPAQPDRTVVISGNRIAELGESGNVPIPKDSDVVDATGKFLIPGLWDMHVHWYEKDYLPLFIANGVTGVRQMWGTDEHRRWRDQIENGELVGPHQVIASLIILLTALNLTGRAQCRCQTKPKRGKRSSGPSRTAQTLSRSILFAA